MNAWTSVLVAFMDSERTTGLSWRSWMYPERQTAVTWAASDSSRSMTTPRSRAVSEMATWVPSTRTSWQSTLSSSWVEPSHSSSMEVGLGPGDFVFDGDARKRAHPPHPIFGPCLLWPNRWMDQDATWYGGKHRPRRRCVTWGRSSPRKGSQSPVFGSCLLRPNGWMDEHTSWYGSRPPRPRSHCIRRGSSSPRKGHSTPLFSAHVYGHVYSGQTAGHGRPSQLLLSSCNITAACDR